MLGRVVWLMVSILASMNGHAGWMVESQVRAYSEPVPMQQMLDGWSQSGRGELAQGRMRTRLGWLFAGGYVQQVGVEKRADYHLKFSRDTARFYSLLEHQGLAAGDYPLDLSVNAMEGNAFYLESFIPLSLGVLTFRVNVIDGEKMQYGSLRGEGSVHDDGHYNFEYDLDYRYTKNVLTDTIADDVQGWGYSVDAKVSSSVYSGLLTLGVTDLFYRVHWEELGKSDGCLFRERAQLRYCDQNFVQDSTRRFVQYLPEEWFARFERHNAVLDWRLWDGEHYFMVSQKFLGRYRVGYEVVHGSVEAVFNIGQAQEVKVGLDHYDVSKSRVWTLGLRYIWH